MHLQPAGTVHLAVTWPEESAISNTTRMMSTSSKEAGGVRLRTQEQGKGLSVGGDASAIKSPTVHTYTVPRIFPNTTKPGVQGNKAGKPRKTDKTLISNVSTISKNSDMYKKDNDKKSAPSKPSKTIIMYSTNGAGVVKGKVES